MTRSLSFGLSIITLFMSGCVGWGPNGNEQFVGPLSGAWNGVCNSCDDHCGNCDGYNPPFGSLRKTLACGSGCGEVYYGEWLSNPPNTCNECDARGHAFGINARVPWLCNPFRFWGFQYRQSGQGYGNPLRATHRGIADYGGYRAGNWAVGYGESGYSGGCSTGNCASGGCASGGCPNGDCGKGLPNGSQPQGKLNPIPQQTKKQVNYVSPLVAARYRNRSTNR